MLKRITEKISQHKVESLLGDYGIELKHYVPGRVRLRIKQWELRKNSINELLLEMKNDQDIQSVDFTPETGSMLIYYNHEASQLKSTQKRWLSTLQKYS